MTCVCVFKITFRAPARILFIYLCVCQSVISLYLVCLHDFYLILTVEQTGL